MSQLSRSFDSFLLVREAAGDHRPANAEEVLQVALRRMLAEQMRGCEALTSPQVVRGFLRSKLGALEHLAQRMFDKGGRITYFLRHDIHSSNVQPMKH